MFRSIALSVLFSLLACMPTVSAEPKETSTPEEFQEMGALAAGRWIGDIKFIADWPGHVRRRLFLPPGDD